MSQVITIGSATMDVFVECQDANIVSVCQKDSQKSYMSYPYGAKIDVSDFASTVGGGGVNTAMNFANLGFKTAAIFKIGDDVYSKGVLSSFENKNVDLSHIIQDRNISTGFSIILVSFQGDRTVLAHRGANAEIKLEDIDFEAIRQAKFLYIAPLNGKSNEILEPIVDFAEKNGVMLCFNAGTTSIKQGFDKIKNIIDSAQVVVMNSEEASLCTGINIRPNTSKEIFTDEFIHPDIKKMLKTLKIKDYQVIVITDGKNGAYAYDGNFLYKCPVYPGPVVSSLGAGDAFASTFCAAMRETNLNIGESLMYASVNSGSVVAHFGATEGLLTFSEIKERLKNSPDYKYEKL